MSEDGLIPELPRIGPLASISPSSFGQLQKCALRTVTSAAHAKLLPDSATAALGNVIHGLLEQAGSGQFITRSAIEEAFDLAVSRAESQLSNKWFQRPLVPLSRSIKDFQVRRNKAVDHLLQFVGRREKLAPDVSGASVTYYEKAIETPDGKIRGRVDAIIEAADSVVIRDYKTGPVSKIEDNVVSISSDFVIQLSMYAAILFENGETRPISLELVTAAGDSVPVTFELANALDLLRSAREALLKTNNTIGSLSVQLSSELMDELAKPSPETCVFCSFRPSCKPYREFNWEEAGRRDVYGKIVKRGVIGNGTIALDVLVTAGDVVRIRQITNDTSRHPALEVLTHGDNIGLFDLTVVIDGQAYREGGRTTIYKLDR